MARVQRKNITDQDRFGMRLNSELKSKIDYAAQLKGVATAGFVKEVLSEAADRTIREHEFVELSRRDRVALVQALLNPPVPSKKSIQAARLYKERLRLK